MQFAISKKTRDRTILFPLWIIVYIAIIGALLNFAAGRGEFDWTRFLVVFLPMSILAGGIKAFEAYNFLKYAQKHHINIDDKGLTSVEFDTITLLPWGKVVDIDVRLKSNSPYKVVLHTESSGKVDLSKYENLPALVTEIRMFMERNSSERGI